MRSAFFLVAAVVTCSWGLSDLEVAKGFNDLDLDTNSFVSKEELRQGLSLLDENGDGKISLDEAKMEFSAPGEAKLLFNIFGVASGKAIDTETLNAFFTAADTNGNGVLDIVEYDTKARKLPGEQEKQLLALAGDVYESLFEASDIDKNGVLTVDEALAGRPDPNGDGKFDIAEFKEATIATLGWAEKEAEADFALADTNDDGDLDVAEVKVAFLELDENGDGRVNKDEFVLNEIEKMAGIRKGLIQAGEIYPSIEEVLNQLAVEAAALEFAQFDLDGNGFVSKSEDAVFHKVMDSNGDGRITAPEMVPAIAKASKVAGDVAKAIFDGIDIDGDGQWSTSELDKFFDLSDTNGDGQTSLQEYIDSSIATVTLAEGVANGLYSVQVARQLREGAIGLQVFFDSVDKNQDEALSLAEFNTSIPAMYDTNWDGKISRLEFLSSFANAFNISIKAAARVFDDLDDNKDGEISTDEFKGLYLSLDVDKDGTVTRFEFVHAALEQLFTVTSAVSVQTVSGLFG